MSGHLFFMLITDPVAIYDIYLGLLMIFYSLVAMPINAKIKHVSLLVEKSTNTYDGG